MSKRPGRLVVDTETESNLPVIVTHTFAVCPGSEQSCSDICKAIRLSARRNPACLSIRVLHDRHDKARVTILSEWKSVDSFNAFIRRSGLMWLERGAHPPLSGTWSFLQDSDVDVHATSHETPSVKASGRNGIVLGGCDVAR
jgi:quinol monooxygenase YgiN